MSEKKKNVMSNTEALLKELSVKIDALTNVMLHISELLEASQQTPKIDTSQQAIVMPAGTKKTVEAKK